MSAPYEELENSIVAQLKSAISEFGDRVTAVASPFVTKPSRFPAAIVFWDESVRTAPPTTIAGKTRIEKELRFTVQSYVAGASAAGTVRLGASGLYSMLYAIELALSGFRPVLGAYRAIWPIVWDRDVAISLDSSGMVGSSDFSVRVLFGN